VVLLRGHHANTAELRPWELLGERFDVTCVVTAGTRGAVAGLQVPTVVLGTRRDRLPLGRFSELAVHVPGDRYRGLEQALHGADLVHSAELGPWFSGQPAGLKESLGFKLVLTVWETIPLRETYRTFRARAYRTATIPAVDLFLATSERARDALVLEGVAPARIEVSAPGIDVDRFRPDGPRESDLVVSPGRLVWEKGHQDVIRAVAAQRLGIVDGPFRRVLVVGRGPEEERLRRYAGELGVPLELRSTPYEEMPAVFARAGCVVLASLPTAVWEEQFGLVLGEAMAAGAPVVASESGAIPEVVGTMAARFPAGDWPELARRLAQAPPPADREWVRDRYSLEAAAARIEGAYRRVLGL
jgi:glycosyltransferase involved in cell wall biosynthesis